MKMILIYLCVVALTSCGYAEAPKCDGRALAWDCPARVAK